MIIIEENDISVEEFSKIINFEIRGDPQIIFNKVSNLDNIKHDSIVYVNDKKLIEKALNSLASVVITTKEIYNDIKDLEAKKTFIIHPYPKIVFTIATSLFKRREIRSGNISKLASIKSKLNIESIEIEDFVVIKENVEIGYNTFIGANCYIGENVKIGNNCYIYPNVTILENVEIGNNCIIHSGTVIGSDGFGYQFNGEKHMKIEQMGKIVIGNNVEIGSNCSIDRGTIDNTLIGNGVKIDNLVQIAHNVTIGDNTVIASQTGIAGGAKIGKFVVLAGQVGIADHAIVEDNVICGAKTGLSKTRYKKGSILMGYPAMDVNNFRRSFIGYKKLPEIIKVTNWVERELINRNKRKDK